jgi:N-acetylglucosaminyldiphosphoundecaprenol N-acetyl-beta-D-mannosaminyltransferase
MIGIDRRNPDLNMADVKPLSTCNHPRISILGIRIDLLDYEKTLLLIEQCIAERMMGRYICASPVHPIMAAQKDRLLKDALNHSWLTVPDGMPVVWAARLLGGQINRRVYGPELMVRSCGLAARQGYSIFLYGATPQTLEKLQTALLERFPLLHISGVHSPPFRPLAPKEQAEIIELIEGASPDILFVGLGAPKQEKWMAALCPRMNVPVTMGVGAAFDFLAGQKRQAPSWMQARGLEWLFRLLNEPTRLWIRYLVYNPLFILLFLRQITKHGWTSRA